MMKMENLVNKLYLGDCINVMSNLPDNSIDCIVTDPPYGISFMSKNWDKTLPDIQAFKQMIRILKPGALAFIMSSPRQDVLWRMMQMLENVGFELRQSFISWIYKCVSEDTEVLTKDGWERFSKSNTFITKEILIYNIENDSYGWEIPYQWSSYNIKDTCYRIKSDYTDQLVTKGHRVPIEQEGKVLYKFVEEVTEKDKILYLEDMSRVQEIISNTRFTREKEHFPLLQSKMQWNKQKESINKVYTEQPRNNEEVLDYKEWNKEKGEIKKGYVGNKESIMEGGSYLLQNKRKLQGSQVYTLSKGIYRNGKEGWLCNGAQIVSSTANGKSIKENRGSSSFRSQPNKQQLREFNIIQEQQGSQVTRTQSSYKTTMAIITKEYYEGLVYCPSVSTGFFVVRRKGKIFITGNTGFPKAYDVSKGIDKRNKRNYNPDFKKYLNKKRKEKQLNFNQINTLLGTATTGGGFASSVMGNKQFNELPTVEMYQKLKDLLELDNRFDSLIKRKEAKRKIIGKKLVHADKWTAPNKQGSYLIPITESNLNGAKKWDGWKSITGLKPALECILMVNKPMSESTIVDNVLKYGTGAINVDGCRIPYISKEDYKKTKVGFKEGEIQKDEGRYNLREGSPLKTNSGFSVTGNKGRFPSNLLASDNAIDSGRITKSAGGTKKINSSIMNLDENVGEVFNYKDVGDQSRYFDLDKWWSNRCIFFDVPKPSKRERNEGCKNLPLGETPFKPSGAFDDTNNKKSTVMHNFHPTVKPIKLMAYLIELGCSKEGIVLDPFVGSGTTCIAAQRLKRKYIGIELNEEYIKIASARLGNIEIVRDFNKKKEKNITKYSKVECSKLDIKCAWRSMNGVYCLRKKGCNK